MTKGAEAIFSLSLWMPDAWLDCPPYQSKYGPGQILPMLSAEVRHSLKELKSDDIKNIRPDLVYIRERK